jgi:hypothetical protein
MTDAIAALVVAAIWPIRAIRGVIRARQPR